MISTVSVKAIDTSVILAASLDGSVAATLHIAGPTVESFTHDQQQATAAETAGLQVFDPVTDDPNSTIAAKKAKPIRQARRH